MHDERGNDPKIFASAANRLFRRRSRDAGSLGFGRSFHRALSSVIIARRSPGSLQGMFLFR
jgi:hypothetical protein